MMADSNDGCDNFGSDNADESDDDGNKDNDRIMMTMTMITIITNSVLLRFSPCGPLMLCCKKVLSLWSPQIVLYCRYSVCTQDLHVQNNN